MKKRIVLCSLLTVSVCLLASCGDSSSSKANSVPAGTEQTTTVTTKATTTSAAETSATTTTEVTTTAVVTTAETTSSGPAETIGTMFTVTVPEKLVQGGQDTENTASNPEPVNFNYVFEADNLMIRHAGANYQTISYDFSGTLDKGLQKQFFLLDCDFDGALDLVAPVKVKENNTNYAIFLWNPDIQRYGDTPVTLDNPTFNKDKKTVTATRQLGSETVMVTGYRWQNATLQTTYMVYADFHQKTISYKDMIEDKTTDSSYASVAEVAAQLRKYQS